MFKSHRPQIQLQLIHPLCLKSKQKMLNQEAHARYCGSQILKQISSSPSDDQNVPSWTTREGAIFLVGETLWQMEICFSPLATIHRCIFFKQRMEGSEEQFAVQLNFNDRSLFCSLLCEVSRLAAFNRDQNNFLTHKLMTFIKLTDVEIRNARFFKFNFYQDNT